MPPSVAGRRDVGALEADPVDRPVDAWLYWCAPPHDKEEWVYMPVMESVAEGLRRFDANASVAYADASVSVDIPGAARALRATSSTRPRI